MMIWKRFGLVWGPKGDSPFARSHGAVPTPVLISPDVIRVYVTCFDEKGRGRPFWVDVDAKNPAKVLGEAGEPLLDFGRPGCFDDNGMYLTGVTPVDKDTLFLYFTGFELCEKIRYRMMPGLAISRDGGKTFVRHSEAPILDRTDGELYFRGGTMVLRDEGKFRMWYTAGNRFVDLGRDRAMPEYDIRYKESDDGIQWGKEAGRVCIPADGPDEHGIGRPWVFKRGPGDYQLFFSLRRRSIEAYRLGYAESKDGLAWVRKDAELGLDAVPGTFHANTIMFSGVIKVAERTYCFYCGDSYGKQGFGVAELQANP